MVYIVHAQLLNVLQFHKKGAMLLEGRPTAPQSPTEVGCMHHHGPAIML